MREVASPALSISPEKIGYIIAKAREFDVKVAPSGLAYGSNTADDDEREILEDYVDDPTAAELRAALDTLNEDEIIDLIALAWVGRGDFDAAEWDEAKALAEERHQRRSSRYLMGIPTLADYLEEGLSALGYSVEE